jgi:hypothetical protein
MFKQLKAATVAGAMALAFMTAAPAFSQSSAIPASSSEVGGMIFNERMMRTMDKNKDGMVSRTEYLEYMGAQFDIMDAKKKGMLTKAEFMDKKMMALTFLPPSSNN